MMVKLSEAGRPAADHRRDIRGRRVTDSAGRPLGSVEDLVLEETGGARYRLLRVEHGGVMGFGATPSLIPFEAARVTPAEVRIARPAAQVADAPLYDPADPGFWDELYAYYGCAPLQAAPLLAA
ncbi:PRC-barrel domain-containing protein [Actinoplanes sp. RD1]|uniref:PRC-barrel domain-containing protein n=1 Tax=Actinoplanes sp. RD1 TaxID=3064538 RepID=UPI00274278F6|nr:PRC-barrel domain-containing protein [Actinoplanes sp. RD1]